MEKTLFIPFLMVSDRGLGRLYSLEVSKKMEHGFVSQSNSRRERPSSSKPRISFVFFRDTNRS